MVTTDAIVEGVHFLPDDPPDTVARKALRVNLSDLAAKGAMPAGFVLTLALRNADEAWLTPFARALGEDATQFGCPLLGGDTVSTPGPLMISITAFGRVPPGKMVRRSGAKPGDRVVVTGTIGDAALGLDVLKGGAVAAALAGDAAARELLVGRYRVPQPRNGAGRSRARLMPARRWMCPTGSPAISPTVRRVRRLGRRSMLASIPLSAAAADLLARGIVGIEALIAGGDDYEILCTIPEDRVEAFVAGRAAGRGRRDVDRHASSPGARRPSFLDGAGQGIALKRLSYSHF